MPAASRRTRQRQQHACGTQSFDEPAKVVAGIDATSSHPLISHGLFVIDQRDRQKRIAILHRLHQPGAGLSGAIDNHPLPARAAPIQAILRRKTAAQQIEKVQWAKGNSQPDWRCRQVEKICDRCQCGGRRNHHLQPGNREIHAHITHDRVIETLITGQENSHDKRCGCQRHDVGCA